LAGTGTISGLVYSFLGISALKHLSRATEIDRTVGWSLWWWLEAKRYDEEGQRLCRVGSWVFTVGAVSWLLAVYFWKR
jgi:hypothetical protein